MLESGAREFRGIVPEHRGHRRTRVSDRAVGIDDHDHVGAVLYERLKARLVIARRDLGESTHGILCRRKLARECQRREHHDTDGEPLQRL